jgi:hypothetical protein
MTYNPAIPAAADDPSVSQGQMLTNFNQANVVMGADHVNFNNSLPAGATAANRGKHYRVRLLNQAAAPATTATEGSLYVATSGGSRRQCYYRRESNGIQIPISTYMGAFCRVTAGALVGDRFNVAAVASGGVGIYNITFTNNFTSGNYASFVQIHGDVGQSWTELQAVGSIQVRTATTAGVFVARNFSLLVIGEIA